MDERNHNGNLYRTDTRWRQHLGASTSQDSISGVVLTMLHSSCIAAG